MNSINVSRRKFMQVTGGLAVSGLAADWPVMGAAGARRGGSWPVACRDVHLKTTGKRDCWSALKALGISGMEVEVDTDFSCRALYHPAKRYQVGTPEGVKELQGDLAANGAVITAFCMHNRLDERLEQELAWAGGVVRAARELKVPAIRIDVVPRKAAADKFLAFAVKACGQLCGVAAGTPVRFGIENHGNTTNDPEFLEKLFAGVGSPQLGLTLDVANFYWYGHPLDEVYRICRQFAVRAVHTHCKSIRYPAEMRNVRRERGWKYGEYSAPIYEGDLDYERVRRILREANYRGDLCLENECVGRFPESDRADILRRETAMLLKLSGA